MRTQSPSQKAQDLADLLRGVPHEAVRLSLLQAEEAYRRASGTIDAEFVECSTGRRPGNLARIEESLREMDAWLEASFGAIDPNKWILRVRYQPQERDNPLTREQGAFVNRSNALLSFLAQVVTELRIVKDRGGNADDLSLQKMAAQYAESIAGTVVRRVTGPFPDFTFVHPQAEHWHHIHAAAQRHLGGLWIAEAKLTEAAIKTFKVKK